MYRNHYGNSRYKIRRICIALTRVLCPLLGAVVIKFDPSSYETTGNSVVVMVIGSNIAENISLSIEAADTGITLHTSIVLDVCVVEWSM